MLQRCTYARRTFSTLEMAAAFIAYNHHSGGMRVDVARVQRNSISI
jgi:hypothetical protein